MFSLVGVIGLSAVSTDQKVRSASVMAASIASTFNRTADESTAARFSGVRN